MQIQHGLSADIMFAFDELTTLVDTRTYQEESVVRGIMNAPDPAAYCEPLLSEFEKGRA